MIQEKLSSAVPGGVALAVGLVAELVLAAVAHHAIERSSMVLFVPSVIAMAIVFFTCVPGLYVVNPNEAKVLQLFGDYVGTVKAPGLCWSSPFYSKRSVSLRAQSLESNRLKVNDADGNPVEIAAIVVWRVIDSAQAMFQVDNYASYVNVQCEAALRNLATHYPYDAHTEGDVSLRGNAAEIADKLEEEVSERVALAGVEVVEARISHLAYAAEIAQAMLQRQQASAIIAARQKIVDGAVGMVEMALERLSRNNVVELDEERKAQMVSNLLVVLCGERAIQPVVNAGTLYS
jgi:regulator of protease activity HflC (stomatin/prohibitin superfamily)